MPRRRPDKVIEHRISLSDFERASITRAEGIATANVGLDAFTATLQAAGTALAGGGAILAAVVLMKKFAPDIIADVTNVTNTALDKVADAILPGTPVEYRRQAQDLAARRAQINREINSFCTLSADTYDQAKCSMAQEAKDQYFADLEAFRTIVAEENKTVQYLIYFGLGDIDPNYSGAGDRAGSEPALTPEEREYYLTLRTEEQRRAFWESRF